MQAQKNEYKPRRLQIHYMTFENLKLSEALLKAVSEQGYINPTPIQAEAIPIILEGEDLFGCAQTGTGKTAAFSIPIIQLLEKQVGRTRKHGVKALILTPTRELAIQIGECFDAYATHTLITHTVIFGGVSAKPQIDALRRGVDVVIATPGRLLDLNNQGHLSLKDLSFFVLDEADRMLDMGFIHDIRRILPLLPEKRQSLFFSATMPSEIVGLASKILKFPRKIEVTPVSSTVDKIEQHVYFVEKADKRNLLIEVLQQHDIESVLIFSRTKHGADRISKMLNKEGIKADAIHGDKSQTARQRALSNFKSKESKVLIATDIAARGIDVDHLSHVINYDIPNIAETYVHRIGRTGRAGREGMAISFCDTEEVEYLHDIKKLTGAKININDSHNAASKVIMDAFKAMQLPKTMTKAAGTQSASRKKEQPWKREKKDGKPQSGQGGKSQGQGGKSQSASGKPQQKREDRRSASAPKSENRRPENRWGKSDRRSGSASGKPAQRGPQRERR